MENKPQSWKILQETKRKRDEILKDFIAKGNKTSYEVSKTLECDKCKCDMVFCIDFIAKVTDIENKKVEYIQRNELPELPLCIDCQSKTFEEIQRNRTLGDFHFVPPVFAKVKYDEELANSDYELLQEHGGLYFYGSIGSGKTTRMFNLMAKVGLYCPFYSILDIFRRIKSNNFANEEKAVEEFKSIDNLFIDDFGTEKASIYEMEVLYEILNHRWMWKKTTIFSSNLSIEEWLNKNKKNTHTVRIIDRLKTMIYPIQILGKSKRKAVKK